ncbi:Saf4/Yju2 family protein [Aspergillus lucknowensis]|uniref:CWC16 protein n=1 Tax=Aspergillus lucknowensis TaxID=176173 RepID=A0ABR4M2A3_9EURO
MIWLPPERAQDSQLITWVHPQHDLHPQPKCKALIWDGSYVPPDLEGTTTGNKLAGKHPLGARARHLHTKGAIIVRFEMPFATWCTNCQPETIIGQGVRFNAEKKKVGNYYSTPIYSFRFKHSACGGWIEIQTDPRNTAYVVVEGGRRRDFGVDEEGRAVGEIAVKVPGGAGEGGADDPFAKVEGKVEDKKVVDEARSRILELQRRQDRDWDDPYEVSRRLRRGFRAERKVLEKKEEGREALREKMSLGIDIVDETEEDRLRASMVEFDGESGGLRGTARDVRTRPLFEKATLSSSSLKRSGSGVDKKTLKSRSGKRRAADLVAERKALFRSELTGNTRAVVDPFLNDASGWEPGVKKRKALGKIEGRKGSNSVPDGGSQTGSGEALQEATENGEKGPGVSVALVAYGSDSE